MYAMRKTTRLLNNLLATLIFGLSTVLPAQAQDIFSDLIVYSVPGMDDVRVERDILYKMQGDTLTKRFDVYYPEEAIGDLHPVVLFVNAGGLEVRRWGVYRSWGRLVAASGMAGVNYDALDPTNADDLRDVVRYIRDHADALGIDADRIAIWAASRNVAVALPFLAKSERDYIQAAVLYYGVTDPAIPLRRDVPVLIARAGLDSPSLNRGIDQQVAQALREDVDLTLYNYQQGQHAFDMRDDTDESRRIIAATVAFMQDRLGTMPLDAIQGPSPSRLYYMIEAGEMEEALEIIRASSNEVITTNSLNALGYLLLGDDLVEEAVAIFRLNIEQHPAYANGYDSLGEGLAMAGQTEEAIRMYERAIELDPDGPTGENARNQIERLRQPSND